MTSIKIKRYIFLFFMYLIILFWMFVVLFPLFWALSTSFKANIYNDLMSFIPKEFTLENYKELIIEQQFFKHYGNSLFVALVTVILSVFFSLMGSYSITRMKFKGRKTLGTSILFCYLIPAPVLAIPLYIILSQLNLINSYTGLILTFLAGTVPFCSWLFIGYLSTVPREIEEAALVDGCNRWGIIFRIVFPLIKPAIVTVVIYSFVLAWSNFLYPLIFITDQEKQLLPITLMTFVLTDNYAWGPLMAGALLVALPVVILFAFLQKYVIQGITLGGVKG